MLPEKRRESAANWQTGQYQFRFPSQAASFLLSVFGGVSYVEVAMTNLGRSIKLTLQRVVALAAFGALLVGCRTSPQPEVLQRFEFQQPHMGTLFTIKLYATDEVAARVAAEAAFAKIAALDKMMTDYDPESELMQLCRRPVGERDRGRSFAQRQDREHPQDAHHGEDGPRQPDRAHPVRHPPRASGLRRKLAQSASGIAPSPSAL